MELEERKQLYNRAIRVYGHQKQLFQLIEECAEVIKEVNKLNRNYDLNNLEDINYLFNRLGFKEMDNFCEELADIEIMLEQVENISESGILRRKIDYHKNIKLERFKETLEMYERN